MEISTHVAFRERDAKNLVVYLTEKGISYEKAKAESEISCFDIYQSSPYWKDIAKYVEEYHLFTLSELHFTKEELQEAEWLTVRSRWHNGYPQPENNSKYETITYTREEFCSDCGCGLKQVAPFRMKKSPRWGNKHFMMLNWIEDELFVNETAKTVLQRLGYSGISFREVQNTKGDLSYEGVYQLVVHHTLPNGCVEEESGLRNILICSSCGTKKLHSSPIGVLAFKREIFQDATDIVKTAEYFGWGKGATHIILVSQKFYQDILNNKLDRNLEFEPIKLI